MSKYDIFLSYRRSGGEYTAKIIKDRLEDMGYRVFFDVESLRSGDFNTALYSVIEECSDFLLVLSPGSLDRTDHDDDWVRLEVAHALKNHLNVIPVMLRGFSFPEALPADIDPIRYKNGIEANSEFFDAFVNRLVRSFLSSKPKPIKRITQNIIFRRTWPVFLSLLALAVVAAGVFWFMQTKNSEFPFTRAEKNLTSEVLIYTGENLAAANTISYEIDRSFDSVENYMLNRDALSLQQAHETIYSAYHNIDKTDITGLALSDTLANNLLKTKLEVADLRGLNDYISQMKSDLLGQLIYVAYYIDPDHALTDAAKTQLINLERSFATNYIDFLVPYTFGILQPIGSSYLKEFKTTLIPQYTNLPFADTAWQTETDEINMLLTSNLTQSQSIVNEMISITGETNQNLAEEGSEMIQAAVKAGFSQDEAESAVASLLASGSNLASLQGEVSALDMELGNKKAELAEKFAPLESDDPGIIWSKMLRFLTLDMPDNAIACAGAYLEKVQATDENASVYIPCVVQFIKQKDVTGYTYGLVALAYHPDYPNNTVYKIGDILVAINGAPCRVVSDIQAHLKDSENIATILRFNEDGTYTVFDSPVETDQNKVLFYNLSEE